MMTSNKGSNYYFEVWEKVPNNRDKYRGLYKTSSNSKEEVQKVLEEVAKVYETSVNLLEVEEF